MATLMATLSGLLKASWQAGVLILLVLALQWLLGRRLKPHWRYCLWLLVAIRLALPWTLPSPVSVFNLLKLSGTSSAAAEIFMGIAPVAATTSSVDSAKQPAAPAMLQPTNPRSWDTRLGWLLGLWFAGAMTLATYLLVTQRHLSKQLAHRRPLLDADVLNLLEDCKQQMGVHVPITLVETRSVGSPALFGFIRPRLLLPEGLTKSFSPGELRHVFLHELGHIKRHDIVAGWMMTGLQILHWFNPLVWLAFHRMRVDREMACDALVLSHAHEGENQSYGHTIIKLLDRFGQSAWAPSLAGTVENQNQLKERITMIASFKKKNHGQTLALILLAALGLASLTDAETSPAQLSKELIGTWVCIGTPGAVGEAPVVGGRFKSLTDGHWSLTQSDAATGAVIFHHGGTWTLTGNEYSETVVFANQSTSNLIHHTFKFKIKLDGDKLTLLGMGNPWKEVWKRVKSDESKPQKTDLMLQGKWRGVESGKNGAATLDLQGSNLEFHGTNTNEWYKATFTAYDTTPKQLVVVIKDCPEPAYVGRTAYAIYQFQDGKLTVTGNEPGNPTVPAGFDAPGSRKLVFTKE